MSQVFISQQLLNTESLNIDLNGKKIHIKHFMLKVLPAKVKIIAVELLCNNYYYYYTIMPLVIMLITL